MAPIRLILLGICVHILLLFVVFEIYFSSPVENGIIPKIKHKYNPPAKRLVLIIADGLRAEAMPGNTPNLNHIMKNRGSWGVAHTRVPTESRPGHVAILGGIYEDPSAIFKGWKSNPIDFDSVINRSTNTWAWGSPDIMNMFLKDTTSHIHLHSYDAVMEDFGKKNTTVLDLWVFEAVEQFFNNQKNKTLTNNGNLFFLHLLGVDTAGHAYKPESEEYKNNIRLVDSYIPKIEDMFSSFFHDNETAFIFTADHGMTNWGSHGAGSEHETETPFIAWGAGIKIEDQQNDIQQIDVASFISVLIGNSIPVNSLGRLPYKYIDTNSNNLNEMILENVIQLYETYNFKRMKRAKAAINFKTFKKTHSGDGAMTIKYLQDLLETKQYSKMQMECELFMDFLIEGIDYYHNYYQVPLLISATIGMIAWISLLGLGNIPTENLNKHWTKADFFIHTIFFSFTYISIIFAIYIQDLPTMFYLYFLFPIIMIQLLVMSSTNIIKGLRDISKLGMKDCIFYSLLFLFGLFILVRGFYNRIYFSVLNIVLSVAVFGDKAFKEESSKHQKIVWILCCLSLAIFTMLPVMKTVFNYILYFTGCLCWLYSLHVFKKKYIIKSNTYFDVAQTVITYISPIFVFCVEIELISPDSVWKYVAFYFCVIAVALIATSDTNILVRLLSIILGFLPFYMMMSTNYELIFLFVYTFFLINWLRIEGNIQSSHLMYETKFCNKCWIPRSSQNLGDYRRAFIFIIQIFIGFFGTGNIASLNSFDPMWTRSFITVFSPFKMSALIVLRIIIPFIFATCIFRAISILQRSSIFNVFCIVLVFSDLMLVQLLYFITNVGSWLEIGMSLSHFIIMEAFVIILLMLYSFSYVLTIIKFDIFNRSKCKTDHSN